MLNIEIRSVNHRYLDLQFRLPDELRALEPGLREAIVARLNRGKIECRGGLNALPAAKQSFEMNADGRRQVRPLSEKLGQGGPRGGGGGWGPAVMRGARTPGTPPPEAVPAPAPR